MHRSLLLALWLLALCMIGVGASAASLDPSARRVAVIVGNSNYHEAPLENPRNDARSMMAVLRDLGFKVQLVEDADRNRLRTVPEMLQQELGGGDLALFYYAGHAIQYRGRNYLVPIDFSADSIEDLIGTSLDLEQVLQALADRGVAVALIVLDACRDNPFGEVDEALGPGLAMVERAEVQTLVAYATSAGMVAEDGSGANSPFTAALVNALAEPGLDVYDVFRTVRGRVREATEGRQLPWVSGSLETAVVLNEVKGEPAPPATVAAADGLDLASVQWRTIAASRDPTDFREFVSLFAGSPLADQARARLGELEERGEPPTPPPELRRAGRFDDVPDGLGTLVTDCDVAASDDLDPARLAEGIPWGLVNARVALRACARDLARDPDNPRLAFLMARSLEIAGRFAEAVRFYERAIAGGYTSALVNLGYMYRSDRLGPSDFGRAFELYRRAALAGHPRGRVNLGNLYLTGRGVPKAEREALAWTGLAAATGWPDAINALGDIYRRGQGVPEDPVAARRYYEQAAALANHEAMNNLGRLFELGRGTDVDLAAAVRWYEAAVERGNRFAPRWLARLYLAGKGVPADAARARALLLLAAERGYRDAFLDLARLYGEGQGVPPDPVEAYAYLLLAKAGRVAEAETLADEAAGRLSEAQRSAAAERAQALSRERF